MIATVPVTVDDDPDEDDHMPILLHDLAAARAKLARLCQLRDWPYRIWVPH